MVLTEPEVVRRPRVFTAALAMVTTGVVIAAADLLANTVGLYAALFAWREHITDIGALTAAILLVLRPSARYTTRP